MKYLKQTLFIAIIGMVFLTSCSKDEPTVADPVINPPAITHYTIKFGGGQNWVQDSPIFEQDLADHATYQTNLFIEGTMKMAGFLLNTNEARYFQKVTTESEIDIIVTEDPAVVSQTLAVEEKEPISIIVEQVLPTSEIEGKNYFLVEYLPGPSWSSSKKLWELDLTAHQEYIGTKFGEKFVLRGIQYLNIDKAMYIVLAANSDAVADFMSNDPAVTSGIFEGTITPYTVNVEQI